MKEPIKMPFSRFAVIKEIDRELGMRRHVWKARKRPDQSVFFIDQKKQSQYSMLEFAKAILTQMSDKDFLALYEKHLERERSKPVQTNLF